MNEWINENSARWYIKNLITIYRQFGYFCRRYDTIRYIDTNRYFDMFEAALSIWVRRRHLLIIDMASYLAQSAAGCSLSGHTAYIYRRRFELLIILREIFVSYRVRKWKWSSDRNTSIVTQNRTRNPSRKRNSRLALLTTGKTSSSPAYCFIGNLNFCSART